MNYENILYQKKNKIGYVTINRPEKLNALNRKTMDELHHVIYDIKNNSDIFAVILTGSGEKAFVAGADINELSEQNPLTGKELAQKGQAVLNMIENLTKPVIAAVNGFALGGGCELAMACHIRIASANARFAQPEVGLGIIPGYGGTQRLTRLVGKSRAFELCLTGDMIDAAEAYRIGLVNKITSNDKLLSTCEEIITKILSKGPVAASLIIEAINTGIEIPLNHALALEASLFGISASTEDMREGTKAFIEKRKPVFKGK
jgi:enoyl-CoA hydratase